MILLLTLLAAAADPVPPLAPAPPAEMAALQKMRDLGRFGEELRSHDSATAVLETWCGERHFADPPKVVARLAERADQTPPPEVARELKPRAGQRVRYRRVELVCGGRVLSRADNWYLPDRLTPDMNRLLDETDMPFGKAVKSLDFRRRTLSSETLLDRGGVLRNRAVLTTPDGRPFSEVVETYTDEVLASGPKP
jgi:chorismate-pyruvate lyase